MCTRSTGELYKLGVCLHEACTRSTTAVTTSRLLLSVENYEDGGKVQHLVKQLSKFDGKNADNFLEWSSKLRVSLSLYSKLIFEIVQGSERPSDLNDDQTAAREGWDNTNHSLYRILYFTTSRPAFSVVRRFEEKIREDGVGHGQDAWTALREMFDGCSREALRAAQR